MKQDIHPKIFKDAQVTCACGNSFTTISVKEKISVEICSACHPFYTGQQKFVDTEGRIDKFRKKQKISEELKTIATENKKVKDSKKTVKKTLVSQPSLKEMLDQSRQQTS